MNDLLSLLSEDAQLTTAQLAVMLNRSEDEVKKRIAAYEKSGVICGYRALVNWEKADEDRATALIELRVTPKRDRGFDEVAERIMKLEEVESVYLMSGGFDLAVLVHARTMQDIALFVARRLAPLDSVVSTATHFILTRYKDGGVVLNNGDERDDRRSELSD